MPSRDEEKRANKRARRKFRHEIYKRMQRVVMRRMRYFATNAQINAAATQLTDRYMHAVDHMPTQVKPAEDAAIPEREACLASSSPQ